MFVLLLFLRFISQFFFFLFMFFNHRPLIFGFISLLSLYSYSSLYPYIFHLLSSLLLLHFGIQTYGSLSHSFVQLLGSQS